MLKKKKKAYAKSNRVTSDIYLRISKKYVYIISFHLSHSNFYKLGNYEQLRDVNKLFI